MRLDFAKRMLDLRILYCGPEAAGKTTSLEVIGRTAPASRRRGLTTVSSVLDPRVTSEHVELLLGKSGHLSVRLHLHSLPASNSFDLSPMRLLRGLDGLVLVLDARSDRVADNLAYIEFLRGLLAEVELVLEDVPLVFQWGMGDLPGACKSDELNALYNPFRWPAFTALPPSSRNVVAPLRKITSLILARLSPLPEVARAVRTKPAPVIHSGNAPLYAGNGGGDGWSWGANRPETRSRTQETPDPRPQFEVVGCKRAYKWSWLRSKRKPQAVTRVERRREQRIRTQRLVGLTELEAPDDTRATFVGRTLNLSRGGMLVEVCASPPECSLLNIQLALDDNLVDVKGRIVRVDGGRLAIAFLDLSPEGDKIICETLARAAETLARRRHAAPHQLNDSRSVSWKTQVRGRRKQDRVFPRRRPAVCSSRIRARARRGDL